MWRPAVDQTVTGSSQQECDRISPSDIAVIRGRKSVHNIPEYTGKIKQKTQYNVQYIGKVFHKYSVVKEETGKSKHQDDQSHQDRNEIQNIPGYRNSPYDHHGNNDKKGDTHLKTVDAHLDEEKDEFRYIYFGYDRFIGLNYLDTLEKTLIKEIPQSDTDKDENCKVLFLGLEHISEHEYIDQHKAKRIQYPPEPVQIGIGYFGF